MIRVTIYPKTDITSDRANWTREHLEYARLVVKATAYPEGKPYREVWEFQNEEDALLFKITWG